MSTIDNEIWILTAVVAPLLLLVGYFAYRWRQRGSLNGVMFGAKVERPAGEVACVHRFKIGSTTLKLHVLSRGSGEKLIGVKHVVAHPMGFDITPFVLSSNQARMLSQLLHDATGDEKSHDS